MTEEYKSIEEQIEDLQEEIDQDESLRGSSSFHHVVDRLEENLELVEELKSYLE